MFTVRRGMGAAHCWRTGTLRQMPISVLEHRAGRAEDGQAGNEEAGQEGEIMPRYVYVQIEGVEKAARVEADAVATEVRTQQGQMASVKLILKKGDLPVGEFSIGKVIGWWLQDE